ncbi:hypothetical protein A3C37_05335 [Candidatus Peribacteria bacterium RIFCSPHIGHO2_02_FULL_53_20]|nr:MAG: hypothetical protein A3C37_05335 [Candidatus Peribacteria bacterium RIFCSPHIGHO2_02_FULL_53_20]OGJ68253.1 MAG: hypothetical protein A3B61_03770 [Candidatus Peribacteria bacterium RIFCSPLOWO2_01_FULL_53_10]OGJ70247.1 MAG: hypothetical protein A3G69_02200 [Candidatus Peribacteria bacterium RIFCSPLOWO2_12_FULL_53_10]
MPKHPTTIRLDQSLHKQVSREAEKHGLNFSNVVHLLLQAYIEGSVHIGVTQYPKGYIEQLEKESASLMRQYKKGKIKSYSSANALFNDILRR